MRTDLRTSLVKVAAHAAHWSGALRLTQSFSQRFERTNSGKLRRASQPRFAILCYHRVGSGGVPFYSSLDTGAFESQMKFLRSAYRIVSMDELCRELEAGGPAGQAVAITFDDGYRDLYTTAFPILRRYGIPATIYLTAQAIDTGEVSWYDRIFVITLFSGTPEVYVLGKCFALGSRESRLKAAVDIVTLLRKCPNRIRIAACAELYESVKLPRAARECLGGRMLTWEQIRAMQGAGISFAAHTMTHPVVRQLESEERERELGASKVLLETKLQRPVEHFAFPFGSAADIDVESCAVLARLGYRSASSTVWGLNTPQTNRLLLRRIGGDEPSIPLFSLRLRRLFLSNPYAPDSLQDLNRSAESAAMQQHQEPSIPRLEPEVKRA